MDPVATTLVILALAIVAFLSNRIPLGIVAIGVSVALWATGVLDLGQALAGFGDPTVIFIATLFVVSEALDSTGVTAWAGRQVVGRAGADRRRRPSVGGAAHGAARGAKRAMVVLAAMVLLLATGIVLPALAGLIAASALVLSGVVTTNQAYRSVSWTTMMALSVAGAASFLTPVATPANTMVLEPGGYRFGDYRKLGLPLLLLFLVVAVLYVPLVWPF